MPTLHERRWPLFSAAAALLLIAWLTGQYPPIPNVAELEDVSPSYNLVAAGALPWFLQWAGIICAIIGCCGPRNMWRAGFFAVLTSFVFAATWWCGLTFMFLGMEPLEATAGVAMFEIQSRVGSSSFFDEILFNFIGPMLGPLQLRGPIDLRGSSFFLVMLSTTLMVGYLIFVGGCCQVGTRWKSARDYLKFVALMLPCFLPPFIRLSIRFAQIGQYQ